MSFHYSGPSSSEVNAVLDALTSAFTRRIGVNLKGLYLHGSMAMGCFRPWSSDIDLLAVVFEPMERETKLALVGDVMEIAEGGSEFRKVEFSVLTAGEALGAKHPIHYILHYSDSWHQSYKEGNAELVITGGGDEDLAAHFSVIRQRGVVLYGAPIEDAIGEVPREDYLRAVWYDIKDAEANLQTIPVFVVLNLCRTLMFLESGRVGSKREGGQWAFGKPELAGYAPVIRAALGAYTQGKAPPADGEALRRFTQDMLNRIRGLLPFPT